MGSLIYKLLNDYVAAAISERKQKSVERNQLANDLYRLISEFSEVGKLLWKDKNEAFYADYVIYGASKAMEEQVEEQVEEFESTETEEL